MKQTINFSRFHDAFRDHNRLDNFTYDGLKALYEWLEEIEGYELDVIALCCEFSEYDDVLEAACEHFTFEGMTYNEDGDELETLEEVEENALEYLQDHTQVITFDTGIIIQDF